MGYAEQMGPLLQMFSRLNKLCAVHTPQAHGVNCQVLAGTSLQMKVTAGLAAHKRLRLTAAEIKEVLELAVEIDNCNFLVLLHSVIQRIL